ncbi:hypothetical protein J6Z48_02945 [bacterium]|nr:hypothetical protein [bacterium]
MSKDNTLDDFISALNSQISKLPKEEEITDKLQDVENTLEEHIDSVKDTVKKEKKKVEKKIREEKKDINKDVIKRLNAIEEQIKVTQRSLDHLSKKVRKIRKEVEKNK